MAFEGDINEGFGRDITLTYTKGGQPGQIHGAPVLEVIPAGMGSLAETTPFDPVTGILVVEFEHNGSAMDGVTVSVLADVDLGDGVKHLGWTGEFNMKGPLGADVVTAAVGAERPITP